MVVYEWKDMSYLGKVTSQEDEFMPVSCPSRMPTCARDANNHRRRHMSARLMQSEGASVTPHNSAASSSTFQRGSRSTRPASGRPEYLSRLVAVKTPQNRQKCHQVDFGMTPKVPRHHPILIASIPLPGSAAAGSLGVSRT